MNTEKSNKKEIGHVITHTHWDREWRYPLWENRMYLARMMEELLDTLDNDPEYRCFLLDGQSVIIEDYLQVRPKNKDRVAKYIKEGRISIGPWYTLPDLYPVDGECLVRNLLKGIRYSDSLGGHLRVAYESFGWGQTAQFPQIYKDFGLDVVLVAKNVSKDRAPDSEFIWESPDGTQVLATRLGQFGRANFFMNAYIRIMTGKEYMSDGFKLEWGRTGAVYHQADENGYYRDYFKLDNNQRIHPECIKEAVLKAWNATGETTVKSHRAIMNGSDSTTSQPALTRIISMANEVLEDKMLVQSTLEEYTDKLKELVDYPRLKIVKGELRDGPSFACSANALMTRPAIKALNKKAQNSLLRLAEPLSVISAMLGAGYDSDFLEIAVKYLLLSHPHDSINGVVQDRTADDETYMLNQVVEISSAVADAACARIVGSIDCSGYDENDMLLVAVNTLPAPRNEVIKVYADIPQEMSVWDFDITDCSGRKIDKQIVSRKEVTIPVDDLYSRPWPFYADRYCFYMDAGEVPAGGYKTYRLSPVRKFARNGVFWPEMRTSGGNEISRALNTLDNEFLNVTVNENGTVSIIDKANRREYANLNYFEDTGDCGDYWIYYPPYKNRTYTSQGCRAKIWTEDNGSLSATIAAEVRMQVPAFALKHENGIKGESRRSDEERELKITSYYTLKRGSRRLDVRLLVENTAEDHRFRAMFDTGIKASNADAAGHFTVDSRPVDPARDRNGEYYPEMQTLPQQYFVDISDGHAGMALINNCMTEYEAMDNGKGTVALTLLRSVRNIICTEFRSAGVFPRQKGGQSLGTHEYEYAIYPHEGRWHQSGVYAEAESFNVPLKLVQTCRHEGGHMPQEEGFYRIRPSDLVMSAFKKAEDRDSYILRFFNPTDRTIQGEIDIFAPVVEAYADNLNEDRISPLPVKDGHTIAVSAGSNKIVTVEIVL